MTVRGSVLFGSDEPRTFSSSPRACGRVLTSVLVACLVTFAPAGARVAAAQEVNPRGKAVLEFQKRLDAYVALHKREAGKLPPLKETDSPEQIATRETLLGQALRTARTGARAGDLFEPVAAVVREVVKQDWRRRSPIERKAMLTEVPKRQRAVPNMVYPTTLPLATSPPALIDALPRLPDELEYRFMGRHLILRDVKANVIVDVLEDAIPGTS